MVLGNFEMAYTIIKKDIGFVEACTLIWCWKLECIKLWSKQDHDSCDVPSGASDSKVKEVGAFSRRIDNHMFLHVQTHFGILTFYFHDIDLVNIYKISLFLNWLLRFTCIYSCLISIGHFIAPRKSIKLISKKHCH